MEVKAKCFFCDNKITGERSYMVNGTGLRMDGRRRPNWLVARPEFKWAWNGLDDKIFYLCPNHTDSEHWQQAFEWAQSEIDKVKV